MCAWYPGTKAKKSKKDGFFENFGVSKIFSKFVFATNRQKITSFKSHARLSKIKALKSISEHFENTSKYLVFSILHTQK